MGYTLRWGECCFSCDKLRGVRGALSASSEVIQSVMEKQQLPMRQKLRRVNRASNAISCASLVPTDMVNGEITSFRMDQCSDEAQ
ncbi:hypothetical protein NDU88_000523 [Pleurodeles waltl]|uniref:Uncharacterized protein n=1 Tax=Pleurodeles waltl TaxID=8319 RepID=A0AAV7M0G9_PLEWA|nr:hypothetical protein NDU88_000523 [Pleurodeles waltl]